jgi:hypothetical protein
MLKHQFLANGWSIATIFVANFPPRFEGNKKSTLCIDSALLVFRNDLFEPYPHVNVILQKDKLGENKRNWEQLGSRKKE